MIDLDELELLEKAATPGPWRAEYSSNYCYAHGPDCSTFEQAEIDADLISVMRNALPALLECARTLEDLCEDKDWSHNTERRARAALERLRGSDEG